MTLPLPAVEVPREVTLEVEVNVAEVGLAMGGHILASVAGFGQRVACYILSQGLRHPSVLQQRPHLRGARAQEPAPATSSRRLSAACSRCGRMVRVKALFTVWGEQPRRSAIATCRQPRRYSLAMLS